MEKRSVIFLSLLLITIIPLTSSYELCEETISIDWGQIKEITDPSQTSETDWKWGPTETINILVEVENKDLSTRDFTVELFFLDSDLEEENITKSIPKKSLSITEGETETLNISFQLDEPKVKPYYLYAKFYDTNNKTICKSLRAISVHEETTITIEEKEKIIVVRNVNGPTNLTLGDYYEYTVEVINLGNSLEEKVLVIMYNTKLGIREKREITSLAVEESKSVVFNLTIPQNSTTKEENLIFTTEYDFRNDTGFGNYYQTSEKVKPFLIQIDTTQISNIEEPAAQNQITEITEETIEEDNTQNEEKVSQGIPLIYVWSGIISLSLIIIISLILLFLNYRKNKYMDTTPTPVSPATSYVKQIQDQSNS
jgi:hypothetical protein